MSPARSLPVCRRATAAISTAAPAPTSVLTASAAAQNGARAAVNGRTSSGNTGKNAIALRLYRPSRSTSRTCGYPCSTIRRYQNPSNARTAPASPARPPLWFSPIRQAIRLTRKTPRTRAASMAGTPPERTDYSRITGPPTPKGAAVETGCACVGSVVSRTPRQDAVSGERLGRDHHRRGARPAGRRPRAPADACRVRRPAGAGPPRARAGRGGRAGRPRRGAHHGEPAGGRLRAARAAPQAGRRRDAGVRLVRWDDHAGGPDRGRRARAGDRRRAGRAGAPQRVRPAGGVVRGGSPPG